MPPYCFDKMKLKFAFERSIFLLVLLSILFNTTNAWYHAYNVHGNHHRNSIDIMYSNENDDATIEIDPIEQERRLLEAELNCSIKMLNAAKNNKINNSLCGITWDSIICWPETPVNFSVNVPCPIYVNKFNRKNKAIKYCTIDQHTHQANWTKTNFSLCLSPSEHVQEDVMETKIIENHMKYIIAIRICGYVLSLMCIFLSIIILLRPKLRCPRNFVHINLFVAFGLRTILVILVDLLRNNSTLFDMKLDNHTANDSDYLSLVDNDSDYIPCRLIIAFFRYSGSVYHVSIFSEAFYLTLLLRFPYYNESKGFKFCIIFSWTSPILWIVPWIFIRVFVESKWCWQIESEWNLIIDIPHTIFLFINVSCTVFIVRTLYSKMMKSKLSREKIIKYRRLAKSILILIPIFGLHFLFFAWLPYARHANDDSLLEIPIVYIETFLNAIQGFVASIACCFIHRDVRVEIILWAFDIVKKLKCLNRSSCIKYLETEYIPKLRRRENRKSVTPLLAKDLQTNNHVHRNDSDHINLNDMDRSQTKASLLTAKHTSSNASFLPSFSRFSIVSYRSNRKRSTTSSLGPETKICCCLFANHKNDFYQNNNSHRKLSISGNSVANHDLNKKEGRKKVLFELEKQDLDSIIKEEEPSQMNKSESSKLNDKPLESEPNYVGNTASFGLDEDDLKLDDKSSESVSLLTNGGVKKYDQIKNKNALFENFKLNQDIKIAQSEMNVCNGDANHAENFKLLQIKKRRSSI